MNTPIQTSLQLHRGKQVIVVQFPNTAALNQRFRQLPGARWSQTLKSWYVPDTTEYRKRFGLVPTIPVQHGGSGLQTEQNKPGTAAYPNYAPLADKSLGGKPPAIQQIHAVNKLVLKQVETTLKLKAYSASTLRTYCNELVQFLKLLGDRPAETLSIVELQRYVLYCIEKEKLSENTIHSRLNALKFYYEQVLHRDKLFLDIPRPKKQQQLPNFFNQQEITAIINCTGNLKHKVMLMLAYSCGLRVSEVVRLKPVQIDSKRMCIRIQQAKGKKDRMVPLSPVLLVMLREYWKHYQPAKDGYLFNGQVVGMPYSKRSLQLVLDAAKKKAGVFKAGSIHALRHSFATHLLDKGTDVTMIMKLLGHNDLKTTLRYLHVTNRDMLRIISPLDDLALK